MRSQIIGSIDSWDQIYSYRQAANYPFIISFTLWVICLLLSVGYWNQFGSVQK
jgi:hypothetical protein